MSLDSLSIPFQAGKIKMPGFCGLFFKGLIRLLNKRFGHPCIQRNATAITSTLPTNVNKVFACFNAFLCNSVLFCAGASRVDPQIAKKKTPIRPHLYACTDLCNPDKLIIKHPFTVGEEAVKRSTPENKGRLASPSVHRMI